MWFNSYFDYILEPDGNEGAPGRRDDSDDIWEELISWNATTAMEEDSLIDEGDKRIYGIAFIDNYWVLTGGANGDTVNYFYLYDPLGNYIDKIFQPDLSGYSLQELVEYNGYLYGVYSQRGSNFVIKMDYNLDERSIVVLDTLFVDDNNLSRINCITVDPDSGHFYLTYVTEELFKYKLDQDSLVFITSYEFRVDRFSREKIRPFGFSWYADDPDGYQLYIYSNRNLNENGELTERMISVWKMNTITGEIRYLTGLENFMPDLEIGLEGKGGIIATSRWNNLLWVFAAVFHHGDGDIVGIFELGPNASWVRYSPTEDTLIASEELEIYFKFSSAELDTGIYYSVNIIFEHNAFNSEGYLADTVKVDFMVTNTVNDEDHAGIPIQFSLDQNWPNPFNMRTTINYSIPERSQVSLKLFDISGRLIATLQDDKLYAGQYRMSFNAAQLPNGVYIYRLEAGSYEATRKMVLLK